jgi:DNA replication and repair protein RecF
LTGKNGSGKTNTLEALNLICGWGSFYNAKANELRTWNYEQNERRSDSVEIGCKAFGEETIQNEISISSRISAKMNKERVSFSELRTHIPALCFLPGDMNLIDGTPSIRRIFIDKLCSMLSIPYAKRLSDYKKLVRHRIKLLRTGKSPNITSHLLSSIGSWIWSIRKSVVRMLNENISIEGTSLLSPFPLKVNFKHGGMSDYAAYCQNSLSVTKENFMENLELCSQRELKAKVPLIGPHRDDSLITISGNKENFSDELSPADVLSRGQKRRVVVSLLITAGKILEAKLKRKPLFFLDEIFSELDDEARQIVATTLYNTGWQIFATSADNTIQNWQGNIYKLYNGEIT